MTRLSGFSQEQKLKKLPPRALGRLEERRKEREREREKDLHENNTKQKEERRKKKEKLCVFNVGVGLA